MWIFFFRDWGHTINILVRVTIRAAIFQTDCNLESRCFRRPYSSELQLSNIEVIKAWTTILALSSSIYFVIWVTTTYILIYQMTSNVMRMAMIGHQPTINRIRMYSPLLLYICSLSKTWDPDDVHCVWKFSVHILWLQEIRWSLISYSWHSWVPCCIKLSRGLVRGILRFVSSGLWAVC